MGNKCFRPRIPPDESCHGYGDTDANETLDEEYLKFMAICTENKYANLAIVKEDEVDSKHSMADTEQACNSPASVLIPASENAINPVMPTPSGNLRRGSSAYLHSKMALEKGKKKGVAYLKGASMNGRKFERSFDDGNFAADHAWICSLLKGDPDAIETTA